MLFLLLFYCECWTELCLGLWKSSVNRKNLKKIMKKNSAMGYTNKLIVLLILDIMHIAAASPTILTLKKYNPSMTDNVEWLPKDNQTIYRLKEGETRRLELNTSTITERSLYLTVSPCTSGIYWAVLYANGLNSLKLIKSYTNDESSTFFTNISKENRYMLELSSQRGGSVVVSVRGEPEKTVRLRLRTRSKRRLAANWDPSPIDPHSTSYCIVASYRKNYTSLCAAQHDLKSNRMDNKINRMDTKLDKIDTNGTKYNQDLDVDNKIDGDTVEDNISMDLYEEKFKNYRRRKFSRSTKVTDEDPMVTCVGDRMTNHLIENLDHAKMYFVSIFGVGSDRRAGVLLATNSVRPRTSTAKRLRENIPYKAEFRGGKLVFYYKASIVAGSDLWLSITACGGAIDVEVLAKGKRLQYLKNIDQHTKMFIAYPTLSSIQETSDESSIQYDSSSSEETFIRYVIKLTPNRKDIRDVIGVELIASSKRWGVNTPELAENDGATVRELRPRRSCHTLDIAFLPATHHATDVIRYCISTRDVTVYGSSSPLCSGVKRGLKTQCVSHLQRPTSKVIIHKINGLRGGKKYAIQVTASTKGISVPYKLLVAETNLNCS